MPTRQTRRFQRPNWRGHPKATPGWYCSSRRESGMSERTKIKVGVLGATGAVGQKFVKLLEYHPWFELTELAASDRSSGKAYQEATAWRQYTPVPESLRNRAVKPCEPTLDCRVVFSGL